MLSSHKGTKETPFNGCQHGNWSGHHRLLGRPRQQIIKIRDIAVGCAPARARSVGILQIFLGGDSRRGEQGLQGEAGRTQTRRPRWARICRVPRPRRRSTSHESCRRPPLVLFAETSTRGSGCRCRPSACVSARYGSVVLALPSSRTRLKGGCLWSHAGSQPGRI